MLNQTAIYALRAMGYLAKEKGEGPILSSTVAEEMEIPRNFLSKILNRLAQAGLINAVRGRGGGVTLARPAEDILLHEVVELFSHQGDFNKCFLGLGKCKGSCGLHEQWRVISDQFDTLLNATTVDQIL